jgi:hypothetical protein
MSNAKWVALFDLLRRAGVTQLRWKFVRDSGTFIAGVPAPGNLRDTGLADVLPSPYAEFREIEWVEVPAEQRAAVEPWLPGAREFPWQESDAGLRVVAYTW